MICNLKTKKVLSILFFCFFLSYLVPGQIIYGTAVRGGKDDLGGIFRYDIKNDSFSVPFEWEITIPGRSPDRNGLLFYNNKAYGTTSRGGKYDRGVLFRWDPDNNEYTKLVDFNEEIGEFPIETLLRIGDKIYGSTSYGGNYNNGGIFEWNLNTNMFLVKHHFEPSYTISKLAIYREKIYYYNYKKIIEFDPITNQSIDVFKLEDDSKFESRNTLTIYNNKLYGITSNYLFEVDLELKIITIKNYHKELITKYGRISVYKDKFYIISYRDIYEWDPESNIVEHKIKLNESSYYGPLLLHNNKFYGIMDNTIYEWDPETNAYNVIANFNNNTGLGPCEYLSIYNSRIYGMTEVGGKNDFGTIYELDLLTKKVDARIHFNMNNGAFQSGPLSMFNGKFYGTTDKGGKNNTGIIFEFDPRTHTYSEKISPNYQFLDYTINGLTLYKGLFYGRTNNTIFEWDPIKNIHKFIHTFSSQRGDLDGSGLVLLNNQFHSATTYLVPDKNVLFTYDPLNGKFQPKVYLKEWFGARGLMAHNGKLYGLEMADDSLFEWDVNSNQYRVLYILGSNIHNNIVAKDNKLYAETIKGIFEYDITNNVFKEIWEDYRPNYFLIYREYLYTISDDRLIVIDLNDYSSKVLGKFPDDFNLNALVSLNLLTGEKHLEKRFLMTGIMEKHYDVSIVNFDNQVNEWELISGTLPPGLTLHPTTGTITGTPSKAGEYHFTIESTDGEYISTNDYTLNIICENTDISPTIIPDLIAGEPNEIKFYQQGLNPNHEWHIVDGNIPEGMSLNLGSGIFSGTPLSLGRYDIVVNAKDETCLASRSYSFNSFCPSINLHTEELPIGSINKQYSIQLESSYEGEGYTWKIVEGNLPSGFQLDSTSGVISGVTSYSGDWPLKIEYGNEICNAVKSYELNIPLITSVDIKNEEKLKVFPNPGNGSFNVSIFSDYKLDHAHVEVYDLLGRSHYKNEITNHIFLLDLSSELSSGSYVLKIVNSHADTIFKRLVIGG